MSTLRYPPLPPQDGWIRVLALDPGQRSEPLRAVFVDRNLADDFGTPYECLSYTWDEPGNETAIQINGSQLAIRPNLFNFIVRLRRPHTRRMLWADAICINQSGNDEKSWQVQMMGSIYSHATHVLAWVGEHDHDSEQLFSPWPAASKGYSGLRQKYGLSPSNKELGHRKSIWLSFLSRKYWTRTWIVQELSLANDISIYCGDDVTSWEDLFQRRMDFPSGKLYNLDRSEREACLGSAKFDLDGIAFRESYTDQLHLVRTICCERFCREASGDAGEGSLSDLVRKYGVLTMCANPMDKVFAFLAMQSRSQESIVRADYRTSPAQLLLTIWLGDNAIGHPLPYMNLLGFTFEDDCHFVDFLIDQYKSRMPDVLGDPGSEGPWKRFCENFLKGVQAVYDSSTQSPTPRLGHYLPAHEEWYKHTFHKRNGHPMDASERELEHSNRCFLERKHLESSRRALRAQGLWAAPSDLARPIDFSRTRQHGVESEAQFSPKNGAARWAQIAWLEGTQPQNKRNVNNRPMHTTGKWYDFHFDGIYTDRGRRAGTWIRPSVIDTQLVRKEFELVEFQRNYEMYVTIRDMANDPWPFNKWN